MIIVAAFEPPTFIDGFDDVAVMGQSIEQGGRHLGVAEHAGPLAEGEVRGDDDGRALVQLADEVEQELSAGLGERQIAEFIEDDELHPRQMLGKSALVSVAGLSLEPIDEVDDVVEPATSA